MYHFESHSLYGIFLEVGELTKPTFLDSDHSPGRLHAELHASSTPQVVRCSSVDPRWDEYDGFLLQSDSMKWLSSLFHGGWP